MAAQDRIFVLNTHGEDYFTGSAADGRQVLMGLRAPCLVAYFFNAEGELQERQTRDWEHPAPRLLDSDIWRIGNAEFRCHLAAQIARWHEEIGFAPGAIRVGWFFDEEFSAGIELLPESLRDISWSRGEKEEREMKAHLKEWQEQGWFVFSWARDYLMSAEGELLKNEWT